MPTTSDPFASVDLTKNLNTGEPPSYSTPPDTWTPVTRLNVLSSRHHEILSSALLPPFHDLQHLTSQMNNVLRTGERLCDSEFRSALCSIQYRLLRLQGVFELPCIKGDKSVSGSYNGSNKSENVLNEIVRLGMLAFLTTVFQTPGIKVRYPYLADRVKDGCYNITNRGMANLRSRDLLRWVLIVGAVAVFGIEEKWLRECWRASAERGESWEEVRRGLQGIMWIDAIHDEVGRQAFEELRCAG